MPNLLYDALIAPHIGNTGNFLSADDGTTISYDAFVKATARMAHVLVAAGITPGDRVAVQSPKTVEMVVLYAAAIQAGAVFLPLNSAYTTDEMDYFVTDSAPGLLVCTSVVQDELRPVADRAGASILSLNVDGSGTLRDACTDQPDTFETVDRADDDVAALLYTSGTTGRSKGAMLTHRNLLSNARALTDLWQITDADVLIHALPVFHTHGLFVALNTALLAGSKVRFLANFDVDAIIHALPSATMLMGVPTFYTRLLADPRLNRDLVANMRLFLSGSAPLLAETHMAFESRTGLRIVERYGLTETNIITSNPFVGDRIAGTVGLPVAGNEVILTDPETGAAAAPGRVGMIEVRGPNVFKGYWNMPEKTAEELRGTGFFITGDLGQFTPEGYLQIVGRIKDLIISGGYNIYPKEIEDVLNSVDGVMESAVFGVPHADYGETAIAAVVLEKGAVTDVDAMMAAVREKLTRFKHPSRIIVLDALPRNTMGKVQKNLLRESYSDRA
jgi:malonyl-CoA/methylmalonyl-CoA synthetase